MAVKLFISQPMNGRRDSEIKAERNKAINYVNTHIAEVEPIDSFFEFAPIDANGAWFLGKSIQALSVAEVAYFIPGWEKARGCRLEHLVCEEYGIRIIEGKPEDLEN